MSEIGNRAVFANNLVRYIERSGKTQKDVAAIVGVAQSTFNDWCKGKKYPRMDKVEILANYFGILKSDLIEDKTDIKKEQTALSDLPESKQALMQFALSVPDDKAEMILRVMKSILEAD